MKGEWRMNELELLSIGDVTWDVFLAPTESNSLCTINDKECFICFSYGEKIPIKSLEYSVGGNAANNAVGTKRLGVKVGLVTTLGGDSIGNQTVEKIEKEGVDMSFVVQQPTAGSNFSTVINYGGERTIFTYRAPRSYEFPVHLSVAPWIYLTSMGESFQPFYNHFMDWLKMNPTIKMAFNPGSRQIRVDRVIIDPVLKASYIIYVNREEAEKLARMEDSNGKEKELLKKVSELGPKVVIVTNGGGGSFLYDSENEKYYKAGVMPVDAYERTGAGDSFGAGCIAAIIRGKTYQEALLWGTVNAASVIGYVGAQKGLLKESDMPEWIERAKSSGVGVVEI
ncbi:hypothetical protein A2863_04170 [Candidatus Woesebacteria bacterium RIFCSPHIGHO2_01_FULL_38_9b]|nr:MAG: hypothetical protein A2863_04170 [Candidatus Woesebacteria bacterium RIFCSPHIGHO2_01_FULL_38_9b]